MSLWDALGDAYAEWYVPPAGLLGQLLDVVRNTPEGRAGHPAAAVGVSGRTWNAWILGARGMPGGSRPGPESLRRLRDAGRGARVVNRAGPRRAIVKARIRWNGYENRNPYRTVRLDGLELGESARRWAAGDPDGAATAFVDAVYDRYGDRVTFEDDDEGRGSTGNVVSVELLA